MLLQRDFADHAFLDHSPFGTADLTAAAIGRFDAAPPLDRR